MTNTNIAPVLVFVYKRLDTLTETINSLKRNFLAPVTDLIIYSDGAKSDADRSKVQQVRGYIKNIEGFKSVNLNVSEKNRGLAKSIIRGVTEVLQNYSSCIVLEDDLITSPNFLNYMNDSLQKYEKNEKVFSISGFTFPIKNPESYELDAYFNRRGCSWGWATWADRWQSIDWEILNRDGEKKNIPGTKILGSDFPSLIQKYYNGTADSWAIPWCYFQYRNNLLTLYPTVSKVKNIGFGLDATHTMKTEKRFATYLDTSLSKNFSLSDDTAIDHELSDQYTNQFSFMKRIKWRILYDLKNLFK